MRLRKPSTTAASVLCIFLPTIAHAVSLADMAPRASNLPSICEAIYDHQIPGCNAHDFITTHCSQSCITALEGLVWPIQHFCGNQGVTGENLIVAYLEGEGPQQLCHNAPQDSGMGEPTSSGWGWGTSSTAEKSTPTPTPDFSSFTSTAESFTSTPSSLLYDTSARTTTTVGSSSVPLSSQAAQSTSSSMSPLHNPGIPAASHHTTATTSPSGTTLVSTTSTTSSPTGYQTNGNDGSGGGSPFDSAGNMGSAASPSIGSSISLLTVLLVAGMVAMNSLR